MVRVLRGQSTFGRTCRNEINFIIILYIYYCTIRACSRRFISRRIRRNDLFFSGLLETLRGGFDKLLILILSFEKYDFFFFCNIHEFFPIFFFFFNYDFVFFSFNNHFDAV